MADSRPVSAFLALLAAGLLAARADAQPPVPPDQGPDPGRAAMQGPRRPFLPKLNPEGEETRERAMRELQKLSPEKRSELWRVVWAVLTLPPEKRQMVLGFDEERRKRAQEEMARAIEENGLNLDEEKKKVFFQRYFEGRRAIEERLRRESDEKRRVLVREMLARLKAEFTTGAGSPADTVTAPK